MKQTWSEDKSIVGGSRPLQWWEAPQIMLQKKLWTDSQNTELLSMNSTLRPIRQ